jgi:phage terminase Nu1 subunit (DNA packaging protein)
MTAADFARAVGATAALLTLLAPARIDVEPSSDDLLHHRTRLAAAQAEQIEIRNAVARREYAPVALLEEALSQTSRLMARVLERLPGELKRKRPHLTAEDIEIVEATVAELRNIAYRAVLAEVDGTDA